MKMQVYSALCQVTIHVFEADLVLSQFGCTYCPEDLMKFADFFVNILWTKALLHAVVRDLFQERIAGIPLIQRKLMKYGREKLTPYERKNYDMIFNKQQTEGWTMNELESVFNWTAHFLAVGAIVVYLFTVVYCVHLFLSVTDLHYDVYKKVKQYFKSSLNNQSEQERNQQ
jgi:hypothetical protein